MCILCGMWAGRRHWAEQQRSASEIRAERQQEQRLLSGILNHYGMHLTRWSTDGYRISGTGRATEIADNLSALWAAAERIRGHMCDPLDPNLLETLRGAGPLG